MARIETSVLLDVNSVTLSNIEIVGNGRLIISDQIGDVTITADGILVKVKQCYVIQLHVQR